MSDAPLDPVLRYGQCWEDADVLAEALAVGPGARVLSIASAGDNALALLADDPAEVVAVDLNPAQIAALALRVAAFRTLDHGEIVELVGAQPSARRPTLYARCREVLDADARAFWDARPDLIDQGIGEAGTFEGFFRRFRRLVLPLAHRRATVERLLAGGGTVESRRAWYDRRWDNRRWRLLFAVATSRAVLGRARYPTAFGQVEGGIAGPLRARAREAVTATDPAENAYLQAALMDAPRPALPRYLRPEHHAPIRDRLGRLRWHLGPLDDVLDPSAGFTHFNLSDVFEYLDPAQADALFARLADAAAPGARLAYWNMLADRRPGPALRSRLVRLDDLADRLHAVDRAPFYRAFHVDEVAA